MSYDTNLQDGLIDPSEANFSVTVSPEFWLETVKKVSVSVNKHQNKTSSVSIVISTPCGVMRVSISLDGTQQNITNYTKPALDENSLPLYTLLKKVIPKENVILMDGFNVMGGEFCIDTLEQVITKHLSTDPCSKFVIILKGYYQHVQKFAKKVNSNKFLRNICLIIHVNITEESKIELAERINKANNRSYIHASLGVDDFLLNVLKMWGFGRVMTNDKWRDNKEIWDLHVGLNLSVTVFDGNEAVQKIIRIVPE